MAKTRLVNLNASGGAFTAILSTQISRRVEIVEDASANSGVKHGLITQLPYDNFTGTYEFAAGDEPVILQDPMSQGRGQGPIVGAPAQQFPGGTGPGATQLALLKSLSASTTVVRVTEYD